MNCTITQIASVVLCAMASGLMLSSLGHSPVIGYIIAGIILGPSGFQFISDTAMVSVFAEMGILFLLFAIGLSLSFEKIKNIWRTSIIATIISTTFIWALMLLAGRFLHLSYSVILVMTFCVTLSSTAVTVKSLKFLKEKDDDLEESTFGVLVAQDLIALLMVLAINFMSPKREFDYHSVYRIISVCLFIAGLIFFFSRYHRHLFRVANFIGSHEDMLTLSVFGLCLGGAVLTEVAGLSAQFGAFIAGLILGNSNMKEAIKSITHPIEEILLMTFFLSVGLLVDKQFIFDNLGAILSSLIFVTFGKTIINIFVFRLCRFPLKESFVISVLLAHTGEFSFMLAYAARKVEIITDHGVKFLISLTALSLFLSPFWLLFAERCRTLTRNIDISSSREFFRLAAGKELHKLHAAAVFIGKFFLTGASGILKKVEDWKTKTKNYDLDE